MRLIQPTAQQSLWLLQTIKYVMGDMGTGPARALIAASQRHWLRTDWDWDDLAPLAEDKSAACLPTLIPTPHTRQPLIQALVILMVAEGRRDWQTFTRIRQLARTLQVKGPALRYLWLWCRGADRLLALDVYWHGFIAQKYRFEWRRRGWGWLLNGMGTYQGLWQNQALTQRYQQLQFLPSNTLGYQFWQFYQRHHYAFPGAPKGIHEGLLFHDMTHVLGGFDTSPEGELLAVALMVGYQQTGDPLASLLFIILQQHAGVQAGLLSQAQQGWLSQPAVADRFIQALLVGSQMRVDLSQHWDPWEVMEEPVDRLRRRYNLCFSMNDVHRSPISLTSE
ncbi:MAG: hypothetical protein AAF921_23200 [Cyanobacteria bacterium P01_D01_bin.44]